MADKKIRKFGNTIIGLLGFMECKSMCDFGRGYFEMELLDWFHCR